MYRRCVSHTNTHAENVRRSQITQIVPGQSIMPLCLLTRAHATVISHNMWRRYLHKSFASCRSAPWKIVCTDSSIMQIRENYLYDLYSYMICPTCEAFTHRSDHDLDHVDQRSTCRFWMLCRICIYTTYNSSTTYLAQETWIRTRITVYIAAVDHADQDVCPTRFRPRGGDR